MPLSHELDAKTVLAIARTTRSKATFCWFRRFWSAHHAPWSPCPARGLGAAVKTAESPTDERVRFKASAARV